MKSHARVVVIGGGVVGVSTLYHLAKKGWSDVVLVERKELTSGSTWHAAGLLPLFNMSYSVGQIHKYSVKFYQELQEVDPRDNLCKNLQLYPFVNSFSMPLSSLLTTTNHPWDIRC